MDFAIDDHFLLFRSCLLCGNFISIYIINRTLHGHLGIRILSSSAESISLEFAALTRERYFQHSKIKFVSPRGRVIPFHSSKPKTFWMNAWISAIKTGFHNFRSGLEKNGVVYALDITHRPRKLPCAKNCYRLLIIMVNISMAQISMPDQMCPTILKEINIAQITIWQLLFNKLNQVNGWRVFDQRGKTGVPGEKPVSRVENQQTQ